MRMLAQTATGDVDAPQSLAMAFCCVRPCMCRSQALFLQKSKFSTAKPSEELLANTRSRQAEWRVSGAPAPDLPAKRGGALLCCQESA